MLTEILAFFISISQFIENDMFPNEMDQRMQFHSSKDLEKLWLLQFH